ncbi:hypothetical protein EG330_03080 [Pectobacterium versatile]|nr:hypothetical protein EG330_03080 [Pectobacterium versatile]
MFKKYIVVKTSNGPIRAICYVTCDATGHKQKSPEWREVFAHVGESAAKLVNTRHTSSCMYVGCAQSPESLTGVSSSGFLLLPRYDAHD